MILLVVFLSAGGAFAQGAFIRVEFFTIYLSYSRQLILEGDGVSVMWIESKSVCVVNATFAATGRRLAEPAWVNEAQYVYVLIVLSFCLSFYFFFIFIFHFCVYSVYDWYNK